MKRNRVLFVVFPGFELLDLSGPASVFNTASTLSDSYDCEIEIVSSMGGTVTSYSGIDVCTTPVERVSVSNSDTIVVVGAFRDRVVRAAKDAGLNLFLKRQGPKAKRLVSVCTGTLLLAASGVIKDQKVTTHWRLADYLKGEYPNLEVDASAIYVKDHEVWTAAGVTSGIDVALAILEEDAGTELKSRVAKMLVVYAHRPGNQQQFSDLLTAQTSGVDAFSRAIEWAEQNIARQFRTRELADIAGMTERTFVRRFKQQFSTTPGRFIDRLRMDRARLLLESGVLVKEVAFRVGFQSDAAFRTAFEKAFNLSPSQYSVMHSARS